jgi:hypothetical protein
MHVQYPVDGVALVVMEDAEPGGQSWSEVFDAAFYGS